MPGVRLSRALGLGALSTLRRFASDRRSGLARGRVIIDPNRAPKT